MLTSITAGTFTGRFLVLLSIHFFRIAHEPSSFTGIWSLTGAFGVISLLAIWTMYRFYRRSNAEVQPDAMLIGVQRKQRLGKIVRSPATPALAILLIPLLIVGGLVGTSFDIGEWDDQLDTNSFEHSRILSDTTNVSLYMEENTEQLIPIYTENVFHVHVPLSWQDEPDGHIWGVKKLTNEPDEFSITLMSPDDMVDSGFVANEHGKVQTIELELTWDPTSDLADISYWGIFISCGDCGNQNPNIGLVGKSDNGNDVQVSVDQDYYQ